MCLDAFPDRTCRYFGDSASCIPNSPLWGIGNDRVFGTFTGEESCCTDLGVRPNPKQLPTCPTHVPNKSQHVPQRIPNQVSKMC